MFCLVDGELRHDFTGIVPTNLHMPPCAMLRPDLMGGKWLRKEPSARSATRRRQTQRAAGMVERERVGRGMTFTLRGQRRRNAQDCHTTWTIRFRGEFGFALP